MYPTWRQRYRRSIKSALRFHTRRQCPIQTARSGSPHVTSLAMHLVLLPYPSSHISKITATHTTISPLICGWPHVHPSRSINHTTHQIRPKRPPNPKGNTFHLASNSKVALNLPHLSRRLIPLRSLILPHRRPTRLPRQRIRPRIRLHRPIHTIRLGRGERLRRPRPRRRLASRAGIRFRRGCSRLRHASCGRDERLGRELCSRGAGAFDSRGARGAAGGGLLCAEGHA